MHKICNYKSEFGIEVCLNILNKLKSLSDFFSQATVPLSHLINAFHSPKSSTASASKVPVQPVQRDTSPEHDPQKSEVPKTFSRSDGLGLTKLNLNNISWSD